MSNDTGMTSISCVRSKLICHCALGWGNDVVMRAVDGTGGSQWGKQCITKYSKSAKTEVRDLTKQTSA